MINIYMFFTIALGIIFLLLGFEFANRMDRTKLFLCMALFLIAVPFLALISKYPGGQWKTGVHFILIFISISFGFVSAFFIADNNKRTALLSNELFYSFLLWSILLTSIWMAVFLTASDILNLVKISVSGALIKGILGGIATSAVFLPFMIFFVQNDFYRRRARLISLFFDNLSMMDDYDVTRELKNEIKKDESLNGHVNSYSTNYPADNDDRRY